MLREVKEYIRRIVGGGSSADGVSRQAVTVRGNAELAVCLAYRRASVPELVVTVNVGDVRSVVSRSFR